MGLNKSNGNMYGFVTHTWNPIGGECYHNCSYCYMKSGRLRSLKKYNGVTHIYEKELVPLGNDKIIFVGSATDMFGEWVPSDMIKKVLKHCHEVENYESTYLFQSKNPERFREFWHYFPPHTILCTTIETNREYDVSHAPTPINRMLNMQYLDSIRCEVSNIEQMMVTMEPILDFDPQTMLVWINNMGIDQFNIGADSKNNGLPEPSPEKVDKFIQMVKDHNYGMKVHIKKNLRRIVQDRDNKNME